MVVMHLATPNVVATPSFYKGHPIRMVKDGEEWHGLPMTNLKNLG